MRRARFLAADTDPDLKALAEEDVVLKGATAELVRRSGDIDARELAKQRELALVTYQFERTAAREEGETRGRAEGKAEGLREAARRLRATGIAREQVAAALGLTLEGVPGDDV